MKFLTTLVLAGLVFSFTSQAETIVSCRKRNPFVYSAFTWVQIERDANQQLLFRYGNGIADQMLEVYFDSPIERTSANTYHYQNAQYELSAKIVKNKLSFTLSAGGKSETRKNHECVLLPAN